jgi:hypothetical protein
LNDEERLKYLGVGLKMIQRDYKLKDKINLSISVLPQLIYTNDNHSYQN